MVSVTDSGLRQRLSYDSFTLFHEEEECLATLSKRSVSVGDSPIRLLTLSSEIGSVNGVLAINRILM